MTEAEKKRAEEARKKYDGGVYMKEKKIISFISLQYPDQGIGPIIIIPPKRLMKVILFAPLGVY